MRYEIRDGILYVPCEALQGEMAPATVMNGRFRRADGTIGFRPLFAFSDLDCQLLAGSAVQADDEGFPVQTEFRSELDRHRFITDETSYIDQFTGSRSKIVTDQAADRKTSDADRLQRLEMYCLVADDAEREGISLADAI